MPRRPGVRLSFDANPEAKKARSKALSRKAYLDAVKRAQDCIFQEVLF